MDSVVVEPEQEVKLEEGVEYANIEEAPQVEQPQEESQVELPDKFKNKSMEDIISSYENLEKELGRKGQELGELRNLQTVFFSNKLPLVNTEQKSSQKRS